MFKRVVGRPCFLTVVGGNVFWVLRATIVKMADSVAFIANIVFRLAVLVTVAFHVTMIAEIVFVEWEFFPFSTVFALITGMNFWVCRRVIFF